MGEIFNFLKESFGDDIEIATPQFERTHELEFQYIPRTAEEFNVIIEKAPYEILIGFGFRKWSSMNSIISENQQKPVSKIIHVPIINDPGETLTFDAGRKDAPIELLPVDEDILLIPGEWYNSIPDGFMVTGLSAESYPFEKGKSDDDARYGCLPYGIRKSIKQWKQ